MVIELQRELSIKKINDFYLQLKDALKKETEITLDFSKIPRIDLSIAQVIIAAEMELSAKGGKIKLISGSSIVNRQLYLVGLLEQLIGG